MPDTCLDTTKSHAPDVEILKVAEWLCGLARHSESVGYKLQAREANVASRMLVDIAADIRATTGRPAPRASDLIDLIRACATKGDVMACVWDHKTALRQMEPGEAVRTLTEALIAMARQSVGGRG